MKQKSVFFVILLFLLEFSLFSKIASRIEGVVIDPDTGQLIQYALVSLYKCEVDNNKFLFEEVLRQSSDTKGCFKFDQIEKGEYFLQVYKEGYAAFGPRVDYEVIYHGGENIGLPLKHRLGMYYNNPSRIKRFFLAEGQIKYIKIILEKEAILLIKAYEKKAQKVTPIRFNLTEFVHPGYIDSQLRGGIRGVGTYQSIYLKEGVISFKVCFGSSFPDKRFENVVLKKGQTKEVQIINDYTVGQVIHGFITDDTGQLKLASVTGLIYQTNNIQNSVNFISDENGEFWIGGIAPGQYAIDVKKYQDLNILYKKEIRISISPEEKKELAIKMEKTSWE